MTKHSSAKSVCQHRRSGVAVVEAALVLPMLILVSMSLLQYAIIMNTIDALYQITRQAARFAAVNPLEDVPIRQKVSDVTKTTTIRYSDISSTTQILPNAVSDRVANSPITVSITYPMSKKVFLPKKFFGFVIFSDNKEVSSSYFIEGAGLSAPAP